MHELRRALNTLITFGVLQRTEHGLQRRRVGAHDPIDPTTEVWEQMAQQVRDGARRIALRAVLQDVLRKVSPLEMDLLIVTLAHELCATPAGAELLGAIRPSQHMAPKVLGNVRLHDGEYAVLCAVAVLQNAPALFTAG